jgi:hypothetical protein
MRGAARLVACLLCVPAATAVAAACPQDGDLVTATGRLGIGRIVPPADPAHEAQTYYTITFDPPLCLATAAHPSGEPVGHAEYLATRLPLRSALGRDARFTGSLELGATGSNERFSFVTE